MPSPIVGSSRSPDTWYWHYRFLSVLVLGPAHHQSRIPISGARMAVWSLWLWHPPNRSRRIEAARSWVLAKSTSQNLATRTRRPISLTYYGVIRVLYRYLFIVIVEFHLLLHPGLSGSPVLRPSLLGWCHRNVPRFERSCRIGLFDTIISIVPLDDMGATFIPRATAICNCIDV